jgi:hypothetical protein
MQLAQWISRHLDDQYDWCIKRLSRNDTFANNTHQAGPYLPKAFMFRALPTLQNMEVRNPRIELTTTVQGQAINPLTVIWYNNKFFGQTRDEVRITNFGGRQSLVLNPESTGSIVIFTFQLGDTPRCDIWVTQNVNEEEYIQEIFGDIEPNTRQAWMRFRDGSALVYETKLPCALTVDQIPDAWYSAFPSGQYIHDLVVQRRPFGAIQIDQLLIDRRECEYVLFRSIEDATVLHRVLAQFHSVNEFINYAQTVLQRRKARSGRSLELHVQQVLRECGLREEYDFSYNKVTEQHKTPDFIFPSIAAYADPQFPATKLYMLAVKTTVKDRWRQILQEADRIQTKHLLTLQEGVSDNQWQEMRQAGVVLVVPTPLKHHYPAHMHDDILSIQQFIDLVRDSSRL